MGIFSFIRDFHRNLHLHGYLKGLSLEERCSRVYYSAKSKHSLTRCGIFFFMIIDCCVEAFKAAFMSQILISWNTQSALPRVPLKSHDGILLILLSVAPRNTACIHRSLKSYVALNYTSTRRLFQDSMPNKRHSDEHCQCTTGKRCTSTDRYNFRSNKNRDLSRQV